MVDVEFLICIRIPIPIRIRIQARLSRKHRECCRMGVKSRTILRLEYIPSCKRNNLTFNQVAELFVLDWSPSRLSASPPAASQPPIDRNGHEKSGERIHISPSEFFAAGSCSLAGADGHRSEH